MESQVKVAGPQMKNRKTDLPSRKEESLFEIRGFISS
jgi:hypothetical protein